MVAASPALFVVATLLVLTFFPHEVLVDDDGGGHDGDD